jgi:hypothetical protein
MYVRRRRRFSHPGVCSRVGWALSSRAISLEVPLKQRWDRYERLDLRGGQVTPASAR